GLDKLKSVSLIELGRLLEQARAEHWQQITLLGPNVRLEPPDAWPLKAADQIFQLQATVKGLAGKLQTLSDLTVLNLSGNYIGAEGAKAIAASLPGLTSLNLGNNNISAEGAKVIAASLTGLTSLGLESNNIGTDGAKAIAASLPGLT